MMVAIDFETYCELDLKEVGLDRYVNHPSFQVLCAAISGAQDVVYDFLLDPRAKEKLETDMLSIANGPNPFYAHNAGFEKAVVARIFGKRVSAHIWFRDTAVLCRYMGYGSSLELAGQQLFNAGKLPAGRRLMKKFSQAAQCPTALDVANDPDWDLYKQYCLRDTQLAQQIATKLIMPVTYEWVYYDITESMNVHGWFVDQTSLELMQQRYALNKEEALQAFRAKHDPAGELNLNSFKQLQEWCKARGILAKSFNEDSVSKMIHSIEKKLLLAGPNLTPTQAGYAEVLDLLKTKQTLGGSSLAKLDKIASLVGEDGRLRYQYLHAGAAQSKRTSGKGVQLQNLKRLSTIEDMDTLIDDDVDWSNAQLASNLRQVFEAQHPEGQLIVADFSAIESRGLAWLAGEDWKIQAYRENKDIYKLGATEQFKVPYEQITKEQRMFGKVGELSCGYGAGPDAVQGFAEKMGVYLAESESNAIVFSFRNKNKKIVEFWGLLDDLLAEVMMAPVGTSRTKRIANNLMRLTIASVKSDVPASGKPGLRDLVVTINDAKNGMPLVYTVFKGAYMRGTNIVYHRSGTVNKPWSDGYWLEKENKRYFYTIYGGKLAGILTQSICRTLFFDALELIGRNVVQKQLFNYTNVKLIGQFHDEAVVEWEPGVLTLESTVFHIKEAMTRSPYPAFKDFPLAVEVNHAHRYIK